MNNETTTGIMPEMTIPDAIKIVRQEAAKNTGEIRSALTMLADYAMPVIPHDEPATENGDLPPKRAFNDGSIPELGIEFKRFYSPVLVKHIAAWNDGNNSHLYELTVRHTEGGEWWATATNDGHVVFRLSSKSKWFDEILALAAMRKYLIRGHRKTWRKVRAAAVPSVPSVPDVPSSGKEV